MSTNAHPLHAAILAADPRDDLELLVYADWLEDQGRAAQAEFLRVQRRLIALNPHDPAAPRLCARREELFQSVRTWYDFPSAWYDDMKMFSHRARRSFPHWLRTTVLDPDQYLLGFVSSATIPAQHFLSLAERLTRFQPVLNVTLVFERPLLKRYRVTPFVLRQIVESPLLRYVTRIKGSNLDLLDLELLLNSPHLSRLRDLLLTPEGMTVPDVERILRAPAVMNLECLALRLADAGARPGGNAIADQAAGLIAGSPGLPKLKHLAIGPRLSPAVATDLRESHHFTLDSLTTFAFDLKDGPTTQTYQRWIGLLHSRWGRHPRWQ